MQVLGPQRDQDTHPLFLREIMLDACRRKDLANVSSNSKDTTTNNVALVLGRLQLQAPGPNDKDRSSESQGQRNRTCCCCQPVCGCSNGIQTSEASENDEGAEALKNEKEVIDSLYYELEQERNAAAVAANESIAMITRQRVMEEKALYDHKAINILKDMLLKREAEKTVLEEEIDISGSRKSSSQEETSAAIKAVEEERLSVLERVKRLEQQLQLLRGSDSCTASHQRKRTSDHVAVNKSSVERPIKDKEISRKA